MARAGLKRRQHSNMTGTLNYSSQQENNKQDGQRDSSHFLLHLVINVAVLQPFLLLSADANNKRQLKLDMWTWD